MCLHVRVQLELVGLVSHREVALSDPVAARLKGHLVPGQPALVAHHGGPVDGRAIDVVVDVAAQVEVVALVGRLDLAALLAGGKRGQGGQSENGSAVGAALAKQPVLTQCLERRRSRTSASAPWSTKHGGKVEKRLQLVCQTSLPDSDRSPETPPPNLVFQDDLGPQGVVGVPLFREGESMLRPLVLCLQGAGHLTGFGVGRARAGELLRGRWRKVRKLVVEGEAQRVSAAQAEMCPPGSSRCPGRALGDQITHLLPISRDSL